MYAIAFFRDSWAIIQVSCLIYLISCILKFLLSLTNSQYYPTILVLVVIKPSLSMVHQHRTICHNNYVSNMPKSIDGFGCLFKTFVFSRNVCTPLWALAKMHWAIWIDMVDYSTFGRRTDNLSLTQLSSETVDIFVSCSSLSTLLTSSLVTISDVWSWDRWPMIFNKASGIDSVRLCLAPLGGRCISKTDISVKHQNNQLSTHLGCPRTMAVKHFCSL